MFISQELRKKNIAEYLIYMWQREDLIRAYGCSLQKIREEYINRFDYSEEMKAEMADWYGDLVRMMNREGCRETGHLQINKLIIMQLSELNAQLLQSPNFPFYNTEYYKVLPYIVELRRRGAHNDEPEIETCFNALYGVMNLRLQNKPVSPDTEHAVKAIATFIGMLSDYYAKEKAGQLELDNDE